MRPLDFYTVKGFFFSLVDYAFQQHTNAASDSIPVAHFRIFIDLRLHYQTTNTAHHKCNCALMTDTSTHVVTGSINSEQFGFSLQRKKPPNKQTTTLITTLDGATE